MSEPTSLIRFPASTLQVRAPTLSDTVEILPATAVGRRVTRARRGLHMLNQLGITGTGTYSGRVLWDRYERVLTPDQLWQIYRSCPDVRACVDSICRRISTWPWRIVPDPEKVNPRDELYTEVKVTGEEVSDWLKEPDKANMRSWQEVCTAWVTDTLIFDLGALEKVRGPRMQIEELVPLPGAYLVPKITRTGVIIGWEQTMAGGLPLGNPANTFEPDDIVVLNLFSNTTSPIGMPLIETILNEVIALLVSSEHASLALDADEIPPGILVLAGLANAAIAEARGDLQQMKGRDHKIRVMGGMNPAMKVEWVELRRSPKDIAFQEVVEGIRRIVWRVFGVMPVEMGSETATRAHAEVQVDVSSSHLIEPLACLVESKITQRILPELVKNKDHKNLCIFQYDRDARLTAEDRQALTTALDTAVRGGIMTRNEARIELGLPPFGSECDILMAETSVGPIPVKSMENGVGPANQGKKPGGEGTPGGEGNPPAEEEEEEEAQPKEQPKAASTLLRSIATDLMSVSDGLPSEWQADGKFKGYRTVNLERLGGMVAGYTRSVLPLYVEACDEALSGVAAILTADPTQTGAIRASRKVTASIERLATRWDAESLRWYRDGGLMAQRSVRGWTGDGDVLSDASARATAYHYRAMEFLRSLLLATIERNATKGIQDAVMGRGIRRAVDSDTMEDLVDEPVVVSDTVAADAVLAVEAVFIAEAYRIENWSGKMVDEVYQIVTEGLNAAEGGQQEWWAEWVGVGDERMCEVCADEMGKGFQLVSSMVHVPGGSTPCGGKCRCVLVFWTKTEVDGGTAVRLNP